MTNFTYIVEAVVRIMFVSFVLWIFAYHFDSTELITIGLYTIMEGVFLHWRTISK